MATDQVAKTIRPERLLGAALFFFYTLQPKVAPIQMSDLHLVPYDVAPIDLNQSHSHRERLDIFLSLTLPVRTLVRRPKGCRTFLFLAPHAIHSLRVQRYWLYTRVTPDVLM